MNADWDRQHTCDVILILALSLLLYVCTLMPGVGWGREAELQRACAVFRATSAPIDTGVPWGLAGLGALWIDLVPWGGLAWRINLLMAVVSSLTLAVVYVFLRQVVTRRVTALMAVTALAFAPAFFLHAVRPSLHPFLVLLFALQLGLAVRHLLLAGRPSLAAVWLLVLPAWHLQPQSLLPTLSVAFFVSIARWIRTDRLFLLFLAVQFAVVLALGDLGLAAPLLLAAFLALQFPLVGWLIAAWGLVLLRHRFHRLFCLLVVSVIGAMPLAIGPCLADLFGVLLIAVVPGAWILAFGLEYLYERLDAVRRHLAFVPALVIASLVALPLFSTALVLHGLHAMSFAGPPGIRIEVTHWRHDLFDALWPPKNGRGAASAISAMARILPDTAVIIVDPALAPAIRFAQDVEGRLSRVEMLALPPEEQMPEAVKHADVEGRRVFVAGIDPVYYDMESFGRMGELHETGGIYEWISAGRSARP